jgi:hypothetical protein
MKPFIQYIYAPITAGVLLVTTAFSVGVDAAESDYSKIKRDIQVMTQVMIGAFENAEECSDCTIKVESNYLASQGAVFSIAPSRGFSFIFNDRDFNFRIPDFTDVPDHADVEILTESEELSDMVEGIVEGVEVSLSDLSHVISGEDFESHAFSYNTDSSMRDALREIRRSERELQNEIREYEIELIHEEEESKIRKIDSELEKLSMQIEANNAKKELMRKEIEKERHIIVKKREEVRERKQQQEQMKYQQVEKIALAAFCDYGSMLKNVPKNEHISLIFEGGKKRGESDQIYVFEKSDLDNCSTPKSLAAKSIKYEF